MDLSLVEVWVIRTGLRRTRLSFDRASTSSNFF